MSGAHEGGEVRMIVTINTFISQLAYKILPIWDAKNILEKNQKTYTTKVKRDGNSVLF